MCSRPCTSTARRSTLLRGSRRLPRSCSRISSSAIREIRSTRQLSAPQPRRHVAERQIVGHGGAGDTPEQNRALLSHTLSLTGKQRPRVLHVATARGDAAEAIVQFYERFTGLGELSHLRFFPWPPRDLREVALSQDAISVGGGNPAN